MTVRELCIALGSLIENRVIDYNTQIMIDNSTILETIQCGNIDKIYIDVNVDENLNTLFIKQGV